MRTLYEITKALEYTRDCDDDGFNYGMGAVYGEKLDRLIEDLEVIRVAEDTVEFERDKALKELNQIKGELAEAFKDGGEVKTSQRKRNTYPGQIALFCSAQGPHSPAMVMEVCGFPIGKVGLRVFSKSGMQDKFVFAQYREDGELRSYQDTWRFID